MQNKSNLILLLFSILASSLQAQDIPESKVPKEVLKAFHESYPSIKKVQWEVEKPNYEAEYVWQQVRSSTLFDLHGNILTTEHEIKYEKLPLPTKDYIKKNNLKNKIKEINLITDAKKKIVYEVEISHRDYMFSEEGNLLEIIQN